MRDTVNVIREGIPAVGLVHEPFKVLSKLAVTQVGMPDAPVLAYPRDLPGKETNEELRTKAKMVIDQMVPLMLSVGKENEEKT